jgi:hypothetical protein
MTASPLKLRLRRFWCIAMTARKSRRCRAAPAIHGPRAEVWPGRRGSCRISPRRGKRVARPQLGTERLRPLGSGRVFR